MYTCMWGGGVHVIMKMNRELFYTKKVMDLYDIYLITDVEILFWPIRLFYFTYITHLFTIDNQWFLPVLRTECLFFWLLFVFRIKKISSLLFVTYNKKKMKCLCVFLLLCLNVYDRCVLSMKIMSFLEFYFLNKI